MNSDPLSESTPRIGNGILRAMSLSAASTHLAVLSGTERFSVQPVAMSVTVNVKAWPPAAVAAVVADQVDLDEPGRASSHSAQVRTGIWLLSSDPGLVPHTSPELVFGSLIGQAAIDGGRRHRHQQCRGLVDDQLPEVTQHGHQFAEHRREPFAGRHSQHRPADRQSRDDIGSVPHWPGRCAG